MVYRWVEKWDGQMVALRVVQRVDMKAEQRVHLMVLKRVDQMDASLVDC